MTGNKKTPETASKKGRLVIGGSSIAVVLLALNTLIHGSLFEQIRFASLFILYGALIWLAFNQRKFLKVSVSRQILTSPKHLLVIMIGLMVFTFPVFWAALIWPYIAHSLVRQHGVHAVAYIDGEAHYASYTRRGQSYDRSTREYTFPVFYDGHHGKVSFDPGDGTYDYANFYNVVSDHGSIGVRYLPWLPGLVFTDAQLQEN